MLQILLGNQMIKLCSYIQQHYASHFRSVDFVEYNCLVFEALENSSYFAQSRKSEILTAS